MFPTAGPTEGRIPTANYIGALLKFNEDDSLMAKSAKENDQVRDKQWKPDQEMKKPEEEE
jgi:hypothetical protein